MSTATELREQAKATADAAPIVDAGQATNVVEALRRVMRDLPAIGKDQTASAQQGGYAYRGIEQITRHAQPLFARHGIIFVPRVESFEIRELVVNGKPWTDTMLLVSYDVFGPGGIDDRLTLGPLLGIGRDNSDKGANKALTQTYKYALLQALTIADAKDDGDGQTHEADAPPTPPVVWNANVVKQHLKKRLGTTEKAAEAWRLGKGDDLEEWSEEIADRLADEWVANQPKPEAPAEAEPTP